MRCKFDVDCLDGLAPVKHEKDEKKWHGKCIKYYRKEKERERQSMQIDEQPILEEKIPKSKENSKTGWQNDMKMDPLQIKEPWDISLVLNCQRINNTGIRWTRFLQANQSVPAPHFWKSANQGGTHSNKPASECQPINNSLVRWRYPLTPPPPQAPPLSKPSVRW